MIRFAQTLVSSAPAIVPAFRPPCVALALLLCAAAVRAESIGAVDTAFKFIGPDHKIVVDVFDDPKVTGVSCYLSRARTGGVKGALGVAEDKSDASVACRQVGEIGFNDGPLPRQDEVFTERASLLFKRVRVVRMVDSKRNTLVYLVYSDRLVDGSPKNSVTAVAVPAATPIPVK
jgi:CreA protein